jgi:L-arabinokinase
MSDDLRAFEQQLGQLYDSGNPELTQLFDRGSKLVLARAPGRLDVMGGFADYSGSLTLELPIREGTFVAVQESSEPSLRVISSSFGPDACPRRSASFPISEIREHSQTHASAAAYFKRDPEQAWAVYIAGLLTALQLDFKRPLTAGLSIFVCSNVPEGKGVGSSAAVEVATLRALSALYGIEIDPVQAALACQRVENLVVGAPSGVMDQVTASCASEGQLLPLLCQPAELQNSFPVPAGLAFWGIDSGLRHQVSGSDYTEVRVAAFMGYAIIARSRGLASVAGALPGQVLIEDDLFGGYLANVTPAAFEREYRDLLPEVMSGAEFSRQFGGITDLITQVLPEASYRVRAATAHPIYEHRRASEFRQLMTRPHAHEAGPRLGALMFEAHDSYSACGLGSTGTDLLVELVRDAGPARGLYGAKITGGGSGGTVAVLGRVRAGAAISDVARAYAEETGHSPHLFSGSSPGAAAYGIAQAQWTAEGWRVEARRPVAGGPKAKASA